MTEKEKAKAYDEAIERAKKLYGNGITEEIFPKLKEDDEKIIRWIIDDIRYNINNEPLYNSEYKKKAEKAIAWLKKQGKNSTHKTKLRFKIDDFIISDYCIGKVVALTNDAYLLDTGIGIPFSYENDFHIWTIQDAKDGDVLSFYSEYRGNKMVQVGIIEKYVGKYGGCSNTFKIYVGVNWDNNLQMGKYMGCSDIYPATKEQRDLLFQKIREAGYKWNDETKTLEKLVEHKFDPKTLKPCNQVIVRDNKCSSWVLQLFSHIIKDELNYPYLCINNSYKYCIPYNDDTKHLVGTTEEAPEFYKYWED